MKIRYDYVTNSSSSSFVAVAKEDYSEMERYRDEIVLGLVGTTEFKEGDRISDLYSKLNYLGINIILLEKELKSSKVIKEGTIVRDEVLYYYPFDISVDYRALLNEIVKEEMRLELRWEYLEELMEVRENEDNRIVYLDQLCTYVGLEEIFKEGKSSIKRFLFNPKSVIAIEDDSDLSFKGDDVYYMKNGHYDFSSTDYLSFYPIGESISKEDCQEFIESSYLYKNKLSIASCYVFYNVQTYIEYRELVKGLIKEEKDKEYMEIIMNELGIKGDEVDREFLYRLKYYKKENVNSPKIKGKLREYKDSIKDDMLNDDSIYGVSNFIYYEKEDLEEYTKSERYIAEKLRYGTLFKEDNDSYDYFEVYVVMD